MYFNSYLFLLLFLPLCLVGYFGLQHFGYKKAALVFLTAMSLWFYGHMNVRHIPVLAVSMGVNYSLYILLLRAAPRGKKVCLWAALIFNLGSLLYYKYSGFFVDTLNGFFQTNLVFSQLLLPLGISYFTFQQISFIVDAYREEKNHTPWDFLTYAAYVTFFPKMVSGPIAQADVLMPQFRDTARHQFSYENFSRGLYLFALGLGKKVLIADVFGKAANWGFGNIFALDSTSAIVTVLSYTIQIYFDFSGYSDMAMGIGKMLNFDLPLNFNSPYKAKTIQDFWDRWHISLTRFWTRYVYIPLGGSRVSTLRTYGNILLVFLISGLWHGANWTFILWGLLHGLFSLAYRAGKKLFDKLPGFLNGLITFCFVNGAWILFRADSVKDAVHMLRRILRLDFQSVRPELLEAFTVEEISFLLKWLGDLHCPWFGLILFFAVAGYLLFGTTNAHEKTLAFRPTLGRALVSTSLLLWSIFTFSGISAFLYSNF